MWWSVGLVGVGVGLWAQKCTLAQFLLVRSIHVGVQTSRETPRTFWRSRRDYVAAEWEAPPAHVGIAPPAHLDNTRGLGGGWMGSWVGGSTGGGCRTRTHAHTAASLYPMKGTGSTTRLV
ncbi:hypothetical protein FIBSPDRAFT_884263 [Athelia psychrophila]|uniref:Uncharacterized protein n=1 Tax=Athelia psychrophila TaxID=1759441 RepID=A0A166T8V4_9AGAM|nr:hypothetical protein FIBSPDRAFT_884263 [Fibularhizoctonia sp. CBS 109695]